MTQVFQLVWCTMSSSDPGEEVNGNFYYGPNGIEGGIQTSEGGDSAEKILLCSAFSSYGYSQTYIAGGDTTLTATDAATFNNIKDYLETEHASALKGLSDHANELTYTPAEVFIEIKTEEDAGGEPYTTREVFKMSLEAFRHFFPEEEGD